MHGTARTEALRPMIDVILTRLANVRPNGKGFTARCPAHEDRDPSLSITDTGDRILLHCHAGCEVQDILDAIGLEWSDLFRESLARNGTLSHAAVASIGRSVSYDLLYLQLPDPDPAKASESRARLQAVAKRYGEHQFRRICEWVDSPRILEGA